MKLKQLHRWDLSTAEAERIQLSLSGEVVVDDEFAAIETVCGLDVSYSGEERAAAACVVMSYPELEVVESVCKITAVCYNYIPGLLSFREIPPLIPALEDLESTPDLFICDGHGIAHPRRFGLACHLGVLLDRPVIGCAKSKFVGSFEEPGERRGSYEYLYHKDDLVGAVLRTEENRKPVFVSIGHKVTLDTSIAVVLGCTGRGRIPEPVRQSHLTAGEE
jgi:deoxyribonuclease V